MPGVAYNPNDTTQMSFLSALALGETGNSTFAATEGVGGSNLAGFSTDAFGFPQWSGTGNSHAAGTFQFEPSTWDNIAQQYNLNFANPSDQNAGAWYLAQQTFSSATGGQSLETALQAGDYQQIQSALSTVWPSVSGNEAAPQGLAGTLTQGTGAPISNAGAASPDGTSSNDTSSSGGGTLIDAVENFFVRGGLIIIGGIVIVIALWSLLAQSGAVPGPRAALRGLVA